MSHFATTKGFSNAEISSRDTKPERLTHLCSHLMCKKFIKNEIRKSLARKPIQMNIQFENRSLQCRRGEFLAYERFDGRDRL